MTFIVHCYFYFCLIFVLFVYCAFMSNLEGVQNIYLLYLLHEYSLKASIFTVLLLCAFSSSIHSRLTGGLVVAVLWGCSLLPTLRARINLHLSFIEPDLGGALLLCRLHRGHSLGVGGSNSSTGMERQCGGALEKQTVGVMNTCKCKN